MVDNVKAREKRRKKKQASLHHRVLSPSTPVPEVVLIDGPGHGAEITLLADEVHLDLEAVGVLVAHPLVAWGK